MSLKSELADRGVKLADVAKELEEAYGNLYTALQLEDKGTPIKHKAVLARLEKVREWLAADHAAEARTEASVEAVGNRGALVRRTTKRPVPAGGEALLTAVAGTREVSCGDVLTVRSGDEVSRYRFLRVVRTARSVWADVFGPLPTSGTSFAPAMRSLPLDRLGLEVPA